MLTSQDLQQPMYLGGVRSSSSDDTWLECIDPTTEDVIAAVPDATDEDVEPAVARATEAATAWEGKEVSRS